MGRLLVATEVLCILGVGIGEVFMFRRRSYSRRRYSLGRRNVARQQGYRTFSSRVGSGFVQPRVTRAPRLERAKFLDLDWTVADNNYYQASAMLANYGDNPINTNSQLTNNKRCLNLVVNGSANNDRTSGRIMMKSIILRGTIYYSPLVSVAGVRVPLSDNTRNLDGTNVVLTPSVIDRAITIFVVYYPRQRFTDYPSWSSLLEVPVTTNSGLDETNIFGARCLLRKTFRLTLDSVSGTVGAPVFALGRNSRRDFAWKLNLNLPAEWNNNQPTNTPALSSMRSGQLMIYALSNAGATALFASDVNSSSCPRVELRARLAFVDA